MFVFQLFVASSLLAYMLAASATERAAAMLAQMNSTEKFAMM